MEITKRLTAEEFLTQLDTASNWMLWLNPAFEEIELIVKDADDKLTAFHGPDPLTTDTATYLAFAKEVERLSD